MVKPFLKGGQLIFLGQEKWTTAEVAARRQALYTVRRQGLPASSQARFHSSRIFTATSYRSYTERGRANGDEKVVTAVQITWDA